MTRLSPRQIGAIADYVEVTLWMLEKTLFFIFNNTFFSLFSTIFILQREFKFSFFSFVENELRTSFSSKRKVPVNCRESDFTLLSLTLIKTFASFQRRR